MAMEAAMEAVEAQLRRAANKERGTLEIRKRHVDKVLHSQSARKVLGRQRADVVWGCVAEMVTTRGHTNKDMHLSDENLAMLKAKARVALKISPAAEAHVLEMTGAVRTWLLENEETNGEGVYVIRPGKLGQLKGARKRTASSRGGPNAIMAAIVLLGAEGVATLMQAPNQKGKGRWTEWIKDAVHWMVENGWIKAGEAEAIQGEARECEMEHANEEEPTMRVLNLGEGWRSVGRHIESLVPGAHVTGADKRGFTYTGTEMGTITAEISHDWSTQSSDLITALSKKAAVAVGKWDLVTLEPECTLLSAANAMNQATGSAHGKWALTEQNKQNSTPQRLQIEAQKYLAAKEGIRIQLESLERHPSIPFILENPHKSELWQLDVTLEALRRNPGWIQRRIGRCAYGREEQKGTIILTNIRGWVPRGSTGNGRCLAGRCTGHKTPSGRTAHPNQTVANSKEKRVDKGRKEGGRYEWTTKAVVNALERELLKEIIEAL